MITDPGGVPPAPAAREETSTTLAVGGWQQLSGIAPRIHPVAAAVREPPDQDSRLGLVKPPALGLLCLVMPSAQAGKVEFASLVGNPAAWPKPGVDLSCLGSITPLGGVPVQGNAGGTD